MGSTCTTSGCLLGGSGMSSFRRLAASAGRMVFTLERTSDSTIAPFSRNPTRVSSTSWSHHQHKAKCKDQGGQSRPEQDRQCCVFIRVTCVGCNTPRLRDSTLQKNWYDSMNTIHVRHLLTLRTTDCFSSRGRGSCSSSIAFSTSDCLHVGRHCSIAKAKQKL